jgi:hypothetical protein
VKVLLGKETIDRQASNREISMQLDYIQLMIKVLDQKFTLLAEKTTRISFRNPREVIPKVMGDIVPSPPV